ncbi:beta alanine synthase [Hyphopichia burtonii NRRL Y-1933]|uniref:Beta alanine synthase n=1 Tax=Hyphopichia burtonii NRRL Y-1933 TaxID=984485 RepID=A0A1E4RHZ8_9ASCO|nr:beta alanine synthase [Hyphopichia burtonii NRRL Y-1933]ODV66836.1 beta alanine synthase [Hyphopichia burtonii NRRL Y-1933]
MTFRNLKIKPGRLLETIHETASSFGAKGIWGPEKTQTGVCRLTLSDLDKQVRDWFINETKQLGCSIKIDEAGSIFATYPGKDNSLPPTAIGSHLDTQPTGGRYDGVYGVLSGLEVLRTLKENQFVPNYPITVINWTNEEGARFPMSIMASSLWSEQVDKKTIYNLKSVTDSEPVTVEHELKRIGYLGDTKASYKHNPIAAHFEIHIEQGPILENEHKEIGIVTGVQAYAWYKVKVSGKASHTGTTPFSARSDALLAASKMIAKGNEIATKLGGLFSVGILDLSPAVVNVIPGDVSFTMDARHVKDETLAQLVEEAKLEFTKISKESGKSISVEFDHIYTSNAVKFHPDCIKCVSDSATQLFGESKVRQITSGAGHDSCATSARVPTSMIFIPSRDGVSHNPEEYSTPEQVENGFQVLLHSVLQYDQLRKDRE